MQNQDSLTGPPGHSSTLGVYRLQHMAARVRSDALDDVRRHLGGIGPQRTALTVFG